MTFGRTLFTFYLTDFPPALCNCVPQYITHVSPRASGTPQMYGSPGRCCIVLVHVHDNVAKSVDNVVSVRV